MQRDIERGGEREGERERERSSAGIEAASAARPPAERLPSLTQLVSSHLFLHILVYLVIHDSE